MRSKTGYVVIVCLATIGATARADVVINEFVYDDMSTDDREFVELYNNGVAAVDISGWTLGGQDVVGPNATVTIPDATILNPGSYWVIGDPDVLNVNQVVTAGFLENDAETLELRSSGVLVDAVVYETNKGAATAGTGYGTLPSDVASNVGPTPGIWGNHQTNDLAGSPLNAASSLGRFLDGRDTNINGRDFGLRPSTPGAANATAFMTAYTVPDVSASAVGDLLPNYGYSFAPPRVIQPTLADGFLNPNAITAPPTGSDRALVEWDTTGGGNAASTAEVFNTSRSSFDIYAYFDTGDMPINFNASNVQFAGSEITVYGIGGIDALNNLTDLSDKVNIGPLSGNGTTGVAWVYEKVGESSAGAADVSEKLYLVDAGAGGDSATEGGMAWTILATVDLSATESGWHRLSISIGNPGDYNDNGVVDGADYVTWRNAGGTDILPNDPTPGTVDASDYDDWRSHFGNTGGVGVARFDDQTFDFTTTPFVGAFGVGYRENTQLGSDTTPDAILRPATFVQYQPEIVGSGAKIPEPNTALTAIIGLSLAALGRQSRSRNLVPKSRVRRC